MHGFRHWRAVRVAVSTVLGLTIFAPQVAATASAGGEHGVTYRQKTVITIPSVGAPLFGDIIFADQHTGLVYFSDDTNLAIDVLAAKSDRLVTMLTGFTGGPAGVVADNRGQLWAVDPGDSATGGMVRVYRDRAPFELLAKVHVGRAATDEIAYDPRDRLIAVTSPDATSPSGAPTPYVSLVSARAVHGHYPVVARIRIPGAPDGAIEQPQWDPRSHMFVESVRATNGSPNGAIAVIDPRQHRVRAMLALQTSCHPAGLAIGVRDEALLGCDIGGPALVSLATGRLLNRYSDEGGCCTDEVWYDHTDHRFYAAEGGAAPPTYQPQIDPPMVAVISARDGRFLTNIALGTAAIGFHQVASIGSPTQVFVPEPDGVHVFVARRAT